MKGASKISRAVTAEFFTGTMVVGAPVAGRTTVADELYIPTELARAQVQKLLTQLHDQRVEHKRSMGEIRSAAKGLHDGTIAHYTKVIITQRRQFLERETALREGQPAPLRPAAPLPAPIRPTSLFKGERLEERSGGDAGGGGGADPAELDAVKAQLEAERAQVAELRAQAAQVAQSSAGGSGSGANPAVQAQAAQAAQAAEAAAQAQIRAMRAAVESIQAELERERSMKEEQTASLAAVSAQMIEEEEEAASRYSRATAQLRELQKTVSADRTALATLLQQRTALYDTMKAVGKQKSTPTVKVTYKTRAKGQHDAIEAFYTSTAATADAQETAAAVAAETAAVAAEGTPATSDAESDMLEQIRAARRKGREERDGECKRLESELASTIAKLAAMKGSRDDAVAAGEAGAVAAGAAAAAASSSSSSSSSGGGADPAELAAAKSELKAARVSIATLETEVKAAKSAAAAQAAAAAAAGKKKTKGGAKVSKAELEKVRKDAEAEKAKAVAAAAAEADAAAGARARRAERCGRNRGRPGLLGCGCGEAQQREGDARSAS